MISIRFDSAERKQRELCEGADIGEEEPSVFTSEWGEKMTAKLGLTGM